MDNQQSSWKKSSLWSWNIHEWIIKPSIEGGFRPELTQAKATASLILKDNSCDWKSKTFNVIHIHSGTDLEVNSEYTIKFLALAAALKLQTLVPGANTSSVGSSPSKTDADSIVSMLKSRRKILCQVSKQHYFLLQCIDNSIHNGCKLPLHVSSHAKKRKPGQENTWTRQDWKNYIADRAADREYHTQLQRYTIISLTIISGI